jgi:hypothetical protein
MPTNYIIEILASVRSTIIRYRRAIGYTLLGILAVLIIALATAAFVARETMPNDRLYTFKVNVYEPALMLTKTSDRSKVVYGTSLLETRFTELLTLRNEGVTDVETIAPLVARAAETTSGIAANLRESGLPNEDRLDAMLQVSIQVKAMETVAQDTEALSHSEDAFEELRKSISSQFSENVSNYASSTDPEVVKQYMGSHVARVTELLPTVALGSAAQRQALMRIEVMQSSLEENDLASALNAILKAEEALVVDGLVYASERGEGPDTAPAATTTEGQ